MHQEKEEYVRLAQRVQELPNSLLTTAMRHYGRERVLWALRSLVEDGSYTPVQLAQFFLCEAAGHPSPNARWKGLLDVFGRLGTTLEAMLIAALPFGSVMLTEADHECIRRFAQKQRELATAC